MSTGEEEAGEAKGIEVVVLAAVGNLPTKMLEAEVDTASRIPLMHKHATLQLSPNLILSHLQVS